MDSESRTNNSDHKLERLWEDYESIKPYLVPEADETAMREVNVEYVATVSAQYMLSCSLPSLSRLVC